MHILNRLLERWTGARIVPDSTSHSLIVRPSMPIPRELRMFGPLPTLYPHDENTPLIRFNEHDAWTISDSFQGCVLLGETGSGKSTAGKHIAKAMLRRGYGGLVTTVKSTDVENWLQWCAETGRLDDVILVHPEHALALELVSAYLSATWGGGRAYVQCRADLRRGL